MATKQDHLKLRIARLERDVSEAGQLLADARTQLRIAQDTGPYPSGPQRCAGCGTPLHSEYEFTDHFEVADSRYLNLGNCPKGARR